MRFILEWWMLYIYGVGGGGCENMRNGDSIVSNVGVMLKWWGGFYYYFCCCCYCVWDYCNNEVREGIEWGSCCVRIIWCGVFCILCIFFMFMFFVLLFYIYILWGGKEGGFNLLYLGIIWRFDYVVIEVYGDGVREWVRWRGWYRCWGFGSMGVEGGFGVMSEFVIVLFWCG